MGKRSDFEKSPRDYYRTFDRRAGDALSPFIINVKYFAEPFTGAGDLVDQLQVRHNKFCMWKSDLEPQPDVSYGVTCNVKDFRKITKEDLYSSEVMITNPPFTRKIFHEAIEHFTPMIDCWWLNQADWIFNAGSAKIMNEYVTDIVTIGRMKWIKGTTQSSVDNFIWIKTSGSKTQNIKFHNLR